MNFHGLDWTIVIVMCLLLVFAAYRTRKYSTSVSSFLAAERSAGRYLITFADGISGVGAISIIAMWQMIYKVGFGSGWWGGLGSPLGMLLAITGWVIYRYRETRVLTIGQFFEVRYSRRFRLFAASICFISGILNFGIFPAVGANFFVNFCGLSATYSIVGIHISTYHSLLVLLIGISFYFTFSGGQVAVIITDFLQSFFCNIVLVAILIILLIKYPMSTVFDGLLISEPGKSMINPFEGGKVDEFNPWYFVIGLVGMVVNRLSWQGNQAYNSSARSPHEAKMAGILGGFRWWGFMMVLTLIPLVAYMIMHHPNFANESALVTQSLSHIENDQVRDQMLVPMTMILYLPVGMMGAFAAVMLAAFMSTTETYMHSWGSILTQDILMIILKKPLTQERHILLLRLSMVFVAVFIFIFSSIFRQTQSILLFFALTGAIWLGGAGVVIIGGMYTRWGTVRGAYAALISGSIIATTGMVLDQCWKSWYDTKFFLTGQEIYFIAMVVSIFLYVIFSLLGKRQKFDLDKMLHRGEYTIASDHAVGTIGLSKKWNWKEALGYTDEFTFGDKLIYWISIGNSGFFFLLFVLITIFALTVNLSSEVWAKYHRYVLCFNIGTSFIVAVWLSMGGIKDFIQFIRVLHNLKVVSKDIADDGSVTDHNYQEPVDNSEIENLNRYDTEALNLRKK
jgi:SSS family solute:Na+ symporter